MPHNFPIHGLPSIYIFHHLLIYNLKQVFSIKKKSASKLKVKKRTLLITSPITSNIENLKMVLVLYT